MGFLFSNYSCKIVQILVYVIAALNCFSAFVTHAQLLPRDEMQNLEAISKALKLETIWNVSETSCSRNEGFNFTKDVGNETGSIISNVTCDCSFKNGALCRIKTIMLKGLNLTGNLPAEFGNLAYLEELNLARNNISGSITPNLSRAPLRFLSLFRNKLTGKIPKEIGDISTLRELVLTQNQLEGSLPKELGNLNNLERLALAQNQLEGSLPKEIGNLKNLKKLIVPDNKLSGTIPKEIGNLHALMELLLARNQLEGSLPKELGNLKNLERLAVSENRLSDTIPKEIGDIHNLTELLLDQNQLEGSLPEELGNLENLETLALSVNNFNGTIPQTFGNLKKLTDLNLLGTYMEGPIPSNLSWLSNLTALRISDLMGPNMPFPDLKNLTKLRRLILKNCSLSGSIPDYIGQNMTDLNTLDLSFNNLTGEIPETLKILGTGKQKHVFLTSNSLSKVNWSWITNGERNWDLSYNNFTERPPLSSIDCSSMNLNLISSYSSLDTQTWCLTKDLPCPDVPKHTSLFINCGGDSLTYNGNEYESDKRAEGISSFISVNLNWGYSSTGVYMGDEDNKSPNFLATNNFSLKTDAEIYNTARIAPLSLKYYGLCLQKGRYKVQLHFAEIVISDDPLSHTGKRIFDVEIQGKVVLKDYSIVERSGGVGKGVTETFDVTVSGSTLEIHLYWAGRGIATFPRSGFYGPLISAITITKIEGQGLSVGAIIGIVVASCVALVVLLLLVLWMTGCLGGKDMKIVMRIYHRGTVQS